MSPPKLMTDHLKALAEELRELPYQDRFLLFCELDRKVDSTWVSKFQQNTIVLVFVPETTISPDRKYKENYWTVGYVVRCTKAWVTINEINPDTLEITGLQLKMPRGMCITIREPGSSRSIREEVERYLDRIKAVDTGLKVPLAPFTVKPSHFNLAEAAFMSPPGDEEEKPPLNPIPTQPDKPLGTRKKKKPRFRLKKGRGA